MSAPFRPLPEVLGEPPAAVLAHQRGADAVLEVEEPGADGGDVLGARHGARSYRSVQCSSGSPSSA